MLYCYASFLRQNLITQDGVACCKNRKQNAVTISFLGRWWQYIKDWFHIKFNRSQSDLSKKEIIKRRKLSNLKDDCNKFIMPRLEQAKKNLGITDQNQINECMHVFNKIYI